MLEGATGRDPTGPGGSRRPGAARGDPRDGNRSWWLSSPAAPRWNPDEPWRVVEDQAEHGEHRQAPRDVLRGAVGQGDAEPRGRRHPLARQKRPPHGAVENDPLRLRSALIVDN